MQKSTQSTGGMTRRDFVRSAAVTAAGAAALAAGTNYVHAAGPDKIRVGLIGCGKRGSGAANDCLGSAPNVEIAAVADLFKDRAEGFAKNLKGKGDQCKVTPETTFSGFDGCRQLMKTDITAGQVYWVGDYGYYPAVLRQPEWGDMEWQIRNWNYFAWLSGDHIVEQHVHNIDIMCWVMKGPPKKCLATGGRQQRTGPEFGHIYDHFAVDFEYDGDVRWSSFCRQNDKTSGRVSEHVAGTKGMSNCSGYISGPNTWSFKGEATNPYVQEHTDLIESIRAGKPLNEGKTVAESTLAAIMGRMSAYTGREINYSWVLKESKLDLTPPQFDLKASLPAAEVAIPGKTPLI